MQRHPLTPGGPLVTPIGLGMAALGRPGYINLGHADDLGRDYDSDRMAARAAAVLDAAWAAGVRAFDAARSYGRGEEFLGQWLRARRIDPTQVVVSSKWGYTYTADWQVQAAHHEVKEHSLAVLERQWAESQSSLGGYLRLYQIHSATLESGVLERAEVVRRLAELRAGGVLIGLSVSGARQAEVIARALEVRVDGQLLFGCVQASWNPLDPSVGPALAAAHAAGLGVIVKEALANGRLTARNTAPGFASARAILEAQAARLGCSLDALALAAALAQPWAGLVLSGASTVEQLVSNLRALDVAYDTEAADALAAISEPPEQYWQTRAGLAWN
ncbi:MAG: aldo/keto reductase [Oscillochloris sp.]|nr:aldo/keto reductase [Oscillochloris sp.]